MKPGMVVCGFAALLIATSVIAKPGECQKQYKEEVQECTKSVLRGTDLAACLASAREMKRSCESGPATPEPNQCVVQCETNHATMVAECEANFDPAQCNPGDLACEQFALALQAGCKQTAGLELEACVTGCTEP